MGGLEVERDCSGIMIERNYLLEIFLLQEQKREAVRDLGKVAWV